MGTQFVLPVPSQASVARVADAAVGLGIVRTGKREHKPGTGWERPGIPGDGVQASSDSLSATSPGQLTLHLSLPLPPQSPPRCALPRSPPASHRQAGAICLVSLPCQQAGPPRPDAGPGHQYPHHHPTHSSPKRGSLGAVSRSLSSCGW